MGAGRSVHFDAFARLPEGNSISPDMRLARPDVQTGRDTGTLSSLLDHRPA